MGGRSTNISRTKVPPTLARKSIEFVAIDWNLPDVTQILDPLVIGSYFSYMRPYFFVSLVSLWKASVYKILPQVYPKHLAINQGLHSGP